MIKDLTPAQQLRVMLVENIQREDLSPVEEARGFQAMMAEMTMSDVARECGVALNRVQSRVAILRLDPEVQERFHRYEIPIHLAPNLQKVRDVEQQRRLAALAARRILSASDMSREIDRAIGLKPSLTVPRPVTAPPRPAVPEITLSNARVATLARLQAHPKQSISFKELAAAYRQQCCICGMDDPDQTICNACPLAEFFSALVGRKSPRSDPASGCLGTGRPIPSSGQKPGYSMDCAAITRPPVKLPSRPGIGIA